MPKVEKGQFSTEGSVHLDALRGLAALVVVLGHTRGLYFLSTAAYDGKTGLQASEPGSAGTTMPTSPAPPAEARITIGNEAVMIFFVLSGFLVGGSVLRSLRKSTWSWSEYLIKRLTRLWVVLIPALLLGLAVDHAGIEFFGGQSIYGSPAGQLIVVGDLLERLRLVVMLGNLFFTQGILVASFGVNESLWSLSFEFWYYLLFPMLAIAVVSRAKPLSRVLALAGFAAISSFVGVWIMMHLLVWMVGALVAWLPLKFSERTARRLVVATAVVLVVAMPFMRKAPVSLYEAEWVFAALSGCLIYLIKHLNTTRRRDWYSAVAGFFSRISYTLYLVHLPLAVFACGLLNRPWHVWAKSGANLVEWLALDVVVIALAYLFYRVFEAKTDSVRRVVSRALLHEKVPG